MKSYEAQQPIPVKGADLVVQCLERAGVEVLFAYPGGQSIELHQSLAASKKIRVILPRHEQGGAFAADGYARACGKTGVCMATSGPGATNLITGIADAYMDSIPVVFITGQVQIPFIGKNAFQETDIIGITRPIVKHSFLVMDAAELPSIFDEAFRIANSGRPGPVVVDIPKNVQQQFAVPIWPEHFASLDYRPEHCEISDDDVRAIRAHLEKSSCPCIYAGGGVISSNASDELFKFAHAYNIPVATTLMGRGAFPEDDPLSLRWLGMHGTWYANYAANECDLLFAIGARFDDRVTGGNDSFAKNAYVIHADIDLSEINKNRRVNMAVIADARALLRKLNENPIHSERKEWLRQIDAWKKEHPLSYRKSGTLQPQLVVETISRLAGPDAIYSPGVGQHQMWTGQYASPVKPRHFLTSGGLGSMGFGLPAAMGAQVACPDKTVINIDGDGSFQMNIQELGTLVYEELPVKMVILDNQHLGMVAQWEDLFYGSRRGNTLLGTKNELKPYPDFVKIAEGYDIPGRVVASPDELEDAVREMLAAKGPFLLDCMTGYTEHVLPMIPPGKTYRDIIEVEQ